MISVSKYYVTEIHTLIWFCVIPSMLSYIVYKMTSCYVAQADLECAKYLLWPKTDHHFSLLSAVISGMSITSQLAWVFCLVLFFCFLHCSLVKFCLFVILFFETGLST